MSNTTIIIIVIIIIVVIIISIVIYFVAFPNNGKNTRPTTPVTPVTQTAPMNAVKYGDTIRLFNSTPNTGGFLVICGGPFPNSENICSQNVSVVDADDNINDVWKILPAPDSNRTNGSAIRYGDSVIIQSNVNNNNLGYCGTTGNTTCGTNVGTRNSMTSNDSSTEWIFRLSTQNRNLNTGMTINNCGRNVTDRNGNDPSLSTWQISTISATTN
jgi:dolichyl-phosphate-mannose--protein O-mannosyl transferase